MKNTHYIKYASVFNFSSSAIQNSIDIQYITKLKARVGVSASAIVKLFSTAGNGVYDSFKIFFEKKCGRYRGVLETWY